MDFFFETGFSLFLELIYLLSKGRHQFPLNEIKIPKFKNTIGLGFCYYKYRIPKFKIFLKHLIWDKVIAFDFDFIAYLLLRIYKPLY